MVGQKAFTEPSPSDWERWETRLARGEEPSAAARADDVRQTCTAFRKQDPDRHAAALAMSREARGYYVDRLVERDVVELDPDGEPRYKDDASDAMKTLHAKRWNHEYAGTGKLDVEIGGSLEVTVDHDFSGILDELERVGLLARGATGALDAETLALLPARTD